MSFDGQPFRCGLLPIAGIVALALAGCSNGEEASEGVVDLRLESFALNLQPRTIAETESMKVASLLYAPLVAVNADWTTEPRLAESWENDSDGSIRFTLKPDVTFSNDQPVTAKDVVATICSAMQPTSPWSWALDSIAHEEEENGYRCTGLVAEDEKTVVIHQAAPVDWLLHALDGPPGWVTPAGAEPGEYGVLPGAGPYTLGAITPDDRVELEARTAGAAIQPRASRVVFHLASDTGLATRMFTDGAVDGMSLTSPQMIDELVAPDGAATLTTEGTLDLLPADRVRLVILNRARLLQRGLSEDQFFAIKAAFWSGIDRQEIEALGQGLLSDSLHTAFLPAANLVTQAVPSAADAEMPSLNLEIITQSDPYSDTLAAVVARTEIPNLSLTYRAVEKSVLINALVSGDYDVITTVIDANISAAEYWASFFTPGMAFVVFGTPIADLKGVDLSNQAGLRRASALIDGRGNWVPIVRENRLFASRLGLTGVRFTPTGQPRFALIGFGE